jgi:hypothetical protein
MTFQIRLGPRIDDSIETRRKLVLTRSVKSKCDRLGWDFEEKKAESCGSFFSNIGCTCHPTYCPECSAETHHISLMLPGVVEHSPIDCSSKGNY